MDDGEFIETEYGRVFIPTALGDTGPAADIGCMLSFSKGGVVVTLIGQRLDADQVNATQPDLEAVSRAWIPQEQFERITSGFQACIDEWRRREEGDTT